MDWRRTERKKKIYIKITSFESKSEWLSKREFGNSSSNEIPLQKVFFYEIKMANELDAATKLSMVFYMYEC